MVDRDPLTAGFPSRQILSLQYGDDDRLHQYAELPFQAGYGVDHVNRNFATPSELAPSIAPFLAAAIEKDRPRRNYYIDSRGKCVYFDPTGPVPPAVPGINRLYTAPSSRVSLGSESLPGMAGYRNFGQR